jgi:type I restriction enzyme S subunit
MELWNGGISWTSPKDLSKIKSNVLLKTEKTLTQAGLKKISSGLLPIGTLLLSSRAPIGYLAITQIPVAINQGYIAILNNEVYSNIFMLFWLKNNMDIIVRNANGSTFLEVSKSVFRSIDLNIPPAELLQQFNVAVLPLFERIVKNEKEIETLIEMRNNLLPKLMSGEIDVTSFSTEAVSSDSDPLKLQPTS